VREKLSEALRAEAAGRPTPSNRLTVGAFMLQWLEDSVRPSTRPSTYSSYSSIVRLHLGPGLGHLPLARLSPQQVQTFLNAQSAAGLSARSVTMERAVLRQALGRAERWGLVSRNVAKLVRSAVFDAHVLQNGVRAKGLEALLAPEAAALVATERELDPTAGSIGVDVDLADGEPSRKPHHGIDVA
jgi:hypothetical protein